MLKKIHEEIQTYYKNKKLENKTIESNRLQEVYDSIPEYKELDLELKNIYKQLIISISSNGEENIKFSKKDIETVIDRKKKLLMEYSYPLDYIENVFDCHLCKDSGYIKNKGQCICYKNKVSKKLMELSKLDSKLEEENFETYILDHYSKEKDPNTGLIPYDVASKIFNYAKKAVGNSSNKKENMYIYGTVGVGKTFLLNAIAKDVLDNNLSVIYLPSQELFNIINAFKFQNSYHELANQSYYDFLCNCDYLLIDDLGTEASTSITQSEFFYILDLRMRTNKATVITSNLNLRNLEDTYSQRISSRISGDFRLLNLIGNDIRKIKKYGRLNKQ